MVQLKYIKRVVLALSNSPVYGGQAQLEGVMFGGKDHTVTAIRRNDESGIKLLLLLTYLYFISLTPLIKRVFQYHGAEHKVINCYEAGLDVTVENVQAQSRLHYRCGSSFILFTVFVGMFLYFFVPTDPLWLRILDRILLIPVVLGISFEVLQATNACRNIPVLRFLGYPGLWLQLLTTREPKDDQVEVAIASFNMLLQVEQQPEIAATLNHD